MTLDYRKLKVLLVAGDNDEAEGLSAMLAGYGVVRIDRAADAGEALKLLKLGRLYDLMLCDFKLGAVNGLSLVKVVRRDNRLTNRYMPIIMMAGRLQPDRMAAIRASGVNDLLSKPLSSHLLLGCIKGVLGQARPFVETKNYFGPDRRKRQQDGLKGRRRSDPKTEPAAEDVWL